MRLNQCVVLCDNIDDYAALKIIIRRQEKLMKNCIEPHEIHQTYFEQGFNILGHVDTKELRMCFELSIVKHLKLIHLLAGLS